MNRQKEQERCGSLSITPNLQTNYTGTMQNTHIFNMKIICIMIWRSFEIFSLFSLLLYCDGAKEAVCKKTLARNYSIITLWQSRLTLLESFPFCTQIANAHLSQVQPHAIQLAHLTNTHACAFVQCDEHTS